MDEYIIVGDDGSTTCVAEGVNIYEYVKEIGGTVVRRDEYVPPPYIPTLLELSGVENTWRDTEMPIAQQNVTALEYGDEYIPGTALQWKKYWLALRKWTADNPDFPDSTKRPVAPT